MITRLHNLTESIDLLHVRKIKNKFGETYEEVVERNEVFCDVTDVPRNEFYMAAQSGMRPVYVFVTNDIVEPTDNYVEYDDERYRIVRTYRTKQGYTEIVVERVASMYDES